jgi:hypothetical protein
MTTNATTKKVPREQEPLVGMRYADEARVVRV